MTEGQRPTDRFISRRRFLGILGTGAGALVGLEALRKGEDLHNATNLIKKFAEWFSDRRSNISQTPEKKSGESLAKKIEEITDANGHVDRDKLMILLGLDSKFVNNQTDNPQGHLFTGAHMEGAVKIKNEQDPFQKILKSVIFSGITGKLNVDDKSNAMWANNYNRTASGAGDVNKCNTYAQFVAGLATYGVGIGDNELKIGHFLHDYSGLMPVEINENNLAEVCHSTGDGRPYTELGARNVALWLDSSGKNFGWETVADASLGDGKADELWYVTMYENDEPADGHNLLVFFDGEGNAYRTQSTYNAFVQKVDNNWWQEIMAKRSEKYTVQIHKHRIVP